MSDNSADLYFETTVHDFKTHISRYMRWLEEGTYRAVILKRRKKTVAMLMPVSADLRTVIDERKN